MSWLGVQPAALQHEGTFGLALHQLRAGDLRDSRCVGIRGSTLISTGVNAGYLIDVGRAVLGGRVAIGRW